MFHIDVSQNSHEGFFPYNNDFYNIHMLTGCFFILKLWCLYSRILINSEHFVYMLYYFTINYCKQRSLIWRLTWHNKSKYASCYFPVQRNTRYKVWASERCVLNLDKELLSTYFSRIVLYHTSRYSQTL